MNIKPKFSVVLIARNEIKVLPRLVKSLTHFSERGGEIVLLDTGSTDGTPELARQLGCVVHLAGNEFRKRINKDLADNINKRFISNGEKPAIFEDDEYFDFASARNRVASLSSNDVVCFADADEEFTALDINIVNSLIDDGVEQFEYNFVFAHDQYGRELIKFVQSKMYDRRVVQWTGIVHEVLTGDAKRVYLSEETYKLEHWQNQETGRHTYLTGLLVDCYLHPEKDRNSHYCARELAWSGRPESAIREFKRHIKMNGWLAERCESMIHIGDCFGQLNKPEEQAEWYSKAFFTDSSRRKPLIKLAQFFLHNKNYQACISYMKGAMEIPYNDFYANDISEFTNLPEEILYNAYGWIGNIPKAQEHLLNALFLQPNNPNYLRDTQYYFSYPENYIEGWMTIKELSFLYDSAKTKKNILEVGSWMGRSTNALLKGAGENQGYVTSVDTWGGSVDTRDMTNWMAKEKDVFEIFKKNTEKYSNLSVFKGKSVESANYFQNATFDMIFIDAGHTKQEVQDDIYAWLPKVKENGIICGHDYIESWMGVIEAVNGIFGKPDGVEGTIWWVDLGKREKLGGLVNVATNIIRNRSNSLLSKNNPEPTKKEPDAEGTIESEDSTTTIIEESSQTGNKIPKKIFTAWFSENGKMPEDIKSYIESQKVEGFEHTVLDLQSIKERFADNKYVQECLSSPYPNKKWVKLTDYLRMIFLYNEGGIFLDADVEVIKGEGFNDLLDNDMFVCNEMDDIYNGQVVLGTAVIGAIPNHPLIKAWIEIVERDFKGSDDICYGSSMHILNQIGVEYQDMLTILPKEFFYSFDYNTDKTYITNNTVGVHRFKRTWIDETIEPGQVVKNVVGGVINKVKNAINKVV